MYSHNSLFQINNLLIRNIFKHFGAIHYGTHNQPSLSDPISPPSDTIIEFIRLNSIDLNFQCPLNNIRITLRGDFIRDSCYLVC
jgi:hypothetical protein